MNLILGHNQFIGISHISEEKAREREAKFSKVENIYKVVEYAADLGYKGMIIETHPRMLEFLNYYKKNRTFDMDFYLQVPYVQGYIQQMNENGLYGLARDIVRKSGIGIVSVLVAKNIVNLAKKDYLSIGLSALQLEVKPFMDIEIKALFLHNVLTDLFLCFQLQDILKEYIYYTEEKLNLNPGFITLNFCLLNDSFHKWNIKPPFVMTPINPRGYDMNPSKEKVEAAIREYKGNIMAMNILGGGAFSVDEVNKYLTSIGNINYCTVGASSKEHLKKLNESFHS
jgi:hypothetical protein